MSNRKYIFENSETKSKYYFIHYGNGHYTEYNEKGDIIEMDQDDRLLDFILECEEISHFPWEIIDNKKICTCDGYTLFNYGCKCGGK